MGIFRWLLGVVLLLGCTERAASPRPVGTATFEAVAEDRFVGRGAGLLAV